jgi:hypothetical protein
MLSERDIELAHPDAFDFVFGNLPSAKRAEFNRHLDGCRYCQGVVEEYSEIGQIIQDLPPHVEPPPDLEDRAVAAMVAALTDQRAQTGRRSDPEDQAATSLYPIPELRPPDGDETRIRPRPQLQPPAGDETRIQPRPQLQPPPEDETRIQPRPQLQPPAEPQARPTVTQLPVWRRYRGRLAGVVAVAAAIVIAAVVVPLGLGGGHQGTPAAVTVVIPLHATAAAKVIGDGAATARATARPAGPSWTFEMTVHGLKVLPGNDVYECWYATAGSTQLHPQLVSGGTFVVDNSGSTTVTMTAGVDPRQFRTMEITAESPGNGAINGTVILAGQTL